MPKPLKKLLRTKGKETFRQDMVIERESPGGGIVRCLKKLCFSQIN